MLVEAAKVPAERRQIDHFDPHLILQPARARLWQALGQQPSREKEAPLRLADDRGGLISYLS